jgi:hypothetical protein
LYVPIIFGICLFGIIVYVISEIRSTKVMRRKQARRVADVRATRPGPGELGALVYVCPIKRRRELRVAIGASLIGLAVFVVVVGVEFFSLSDRSYDHVVPIGGFGTLAGLAFAVMISGATFSVRYLRQRDEQFRLHEGGFVHVNAHGTRTIRWGDIAYVDHSRSGMRWSAAGKVKLRDGRRVVIAGMIEDGSALVETIRKAVHEGLYPRRARTSGD